MAARAADAGCALPGAIADVFTGIAAEQGFKRPRFLVEPGSELGDGYTSVIYRVTIEDEEKLGRADALKAICKTVASGTAEGFLKAIFLSEECMYKEVLPAMEDLAHLEGPMPWPKCLFASAGVPPCMVMVDLRPRGFTMADRTKPLDAAHCRLALRQLARFHGAGMVLRLRRPELFAATTDRLGQGFGHPGLQQVFLQFFRPYADSPDVIKDRFSDDVYRKLKKMFASFANDYFAMAKMPKDSPANALLHGDCHINNMMFQYDEGGAVTDCCLIDFQTARFGCTAWDVSTLLLPCTEKAMRDEHWDGLLRGYHAELQATLRAAGVPDPDAVYSWDQFMAALSTEYRLGLCFTPAMVNTVVADDKEAQRELRDAVHGMAGEGEGAELVALASQPLKATPEMKQRFGDVVQNLVDWGWL